MENVEKALVVVLDRLRKLHHQGIRVSMKPSRGASMEEVRTKYEEKEGTLLPKYWYHVTFFVETREQADAVRTAQFKLREEDEITFDTGFSVGDAVQELDWELDYSLVAHKEVLHFPRQALSVMLMQTISIVSKKEDKIQ